MMKNKKELATRGYLCVKPSLPEYSAPYIVTDPKGELLNNYNEKKIRENGYKLIVSELKR